MLFLGNGNFQYFVLIVAGVATLIVVVENQCMAYVIPVAKCDMDISIKEQGLITSIAFFGVILSSHMWGLLNDTWGRYKTLRLTLFLTFLSSSASSMAWSSLMLAVTRFLVGFW